MGIFVFTSTKDRIFWLLRVIRIGFGGILRALNKKKKVQGVPMLETNLVI